MQVGFDVKEFEPGKFRWYGLAAETGTLKQAIISPVEFASKSDAETDLQQHCAAPCDETGRKVRTKEELQQLLRFASERHEDCNGTYVGGIYWHEADASGCNWGVSIMKGDAAVGCLGYLNQVATQLRAAYNIPAEG